MARNGQIKILARCPESTPTGAQCLQPKGPQGPAAAGRPDHLTSARWHGPVARAQPTSPLAHGPWRALCPELLADAAGGRGRSSPGGAVGTTLPNLLGTPVQPRTPSAKARLPSIRGELFLLRRARPVSPGTMLYAKSSLPGRLRPTACNRAKALRRSPGTGARSTGPPGLLAGVPGI